METCNVHNTKLQQLSDALSSEERDMANKLLQLGQSHLMVFHFVGLGRLWSCSDFVIVATFLYQLDFPAACGRYQGYII